MYTTLHSSSSSAWHPTPTEQGTAAASGGERQGRIATSLWTANNTTRAHTHMRSSASRFGTDKVSQHGDEIPGLHAEDHALFSDEYNSVLQDTNSRVMELDGNMTEGDRKARLNEVLQEQGQEALMRILENAGDVICKQYCFAPAIGFIDHAKQKQSTHKQASDVQSALRMERNLWKLVSACNEFDYGRSLEDSDTYVFPQDTAMHDRRIIEAELQTNKESKLLFILLRWLTESAYDTLTVHVPGPTATTLDQKKKEELRRLIKNNRSQEHTMMGNLSSEELLEHVFERDEDGIVRSAQDLWFDTRRRKVTPRSNDLDPDGPHRLAFSVDEAASARQHKTYLTEEDSTTELEVLESVWTCVRAGKLQLAVDICQLYGHYWRASMLCGGAFPMDTNRDDVESMGCELGYEFAPSYVMPFGDIPRIDWKLGNPRYLQWRNTLKRYCKKLEGFVTDSPSKNEWMYDTKRTLGLIRYELGISGLFSLNFRSLAVSGLLNTWEDNAWALARIGLMAHLDETVESHKRKQSETFKAIPPCDHPPNLETLTTSQDMSRLPYCFGSETQSSHTRHGKDPSSAFKDLTVTKIFDLLGEVDPGLRSMFGETLKEHVRSQEKSAGFRIARAVMMLAADPSNLASVLSELDKVTAANLQGTALDSTVSNILEGSAATSTGPVSLGRSAPATLVTRQHKTTNASLIPVRRFVALFIVFLRDYGILRNHIPPTTHRHPLYSPCAISDSTYDGIHPEYSTQPWIWLHCDRLIARFVECLLCSSAPHKTAEYICRLAAPQAIRLYASVLQRLPNSVDRKLALREGWKCFPGLMPNILRTAGAGLVTPHLTESEDLEDSDLKDAMFNEDNALLPVSNIPEELSEMRIDSHCWRKFQGLTLISDAIDSSFRCESVLKGDVWRLGADLVCLANAFLRSLFYEYFRCNNADEQEAKLRVAEILLFGRERVQPIIRADVVQDVRNKLESMSPADRETLGFEEHLKTHTEIDIILLEFEDWVHLVRALVIESRVRSTIASGHLSSRNQELVNSLSSDVRHYHFTCEDFMLTSRGWLVPFEGESSDSCSMDQRLDYRGAYVFKKRDIKLDDDPNIVGRSALPVTVSCLRSIVLPRLVLRLLDLHERFGMWVMGTGTSNAIEGFDQRMTWQQQNVEIVSQHFSDAIRIADTLANEGLGDESRTLHYAFDQEQLDVILDRISLLTMKLMHLRGFA